MKVTVYNFTIESSKNEKCAKWFIFAAFPTMSSFERSSMFIAVGWFIFAPICGCCSIDSFYGEIVPVVIFAPLKVSIREVCIPPSIGDVATCTL